MGEAKRRISEHLQTFGKRLETFEPQEHAGSDGNVHRIPACGQAEQVGGWAEQNANFLRSTGETANHSAQLHDSVRGGNEQG